MKKYTGRKNLTVAIGFKTALTAICAVLLSIAIILIATGNNKPAAANTSVPTSTTVGLIYDFDQSCYSETALDSLAQQILGGDKKFSDLVAEARATGTKGKAITDNRDITLQYGRYTYTTTGSTVRNLAWIPVYMSASRSNDAILTLYLAATYSDNGSVSRQEALPFTNNGTWSTDVSYAPSSSYATSYMNAMALGNGGLYTTYNNTHSGYSTPQQAVIKSNECNKFSDFIMGSDFTGTFYDDIATPADIMWQETESYAASIGKWNGNDYFWPNDAYGTPTVGEFCNKGTYNYSTKMNYALWKNSKVWLPSITEVGTGTVADDGTDNTNGMWKLTDSQRSNSVKSWLRSAYTADPNAYTMFCTSQNGAGYTTAKVSEKCGIRPAIHLNLSKIVKKMVPPINLPESVSVTYNGEAQTVEDVDPEHLSWYDSSIMSTNYFSNETCTMPASTIDAKEYYMRVELHNTDRYFLGESSDLKYKVIKFIIKKVVLGVTWEYDSTNTPISVTVDYSKVYQRDIEAENVPIVGMKYNSLASAGIKDSVEFPDIKGQYTASAYIIDEEDHTYNYEVSGEDSYIFIVNERRVPVPTFSTGGNLLELSYRGRQEVQLYDITKYVEISIVGQNSNIEMREPDLVNGIQTFTVETVGTYEIKVKLKDTDNTVWDDPNESMRIEERIYTVRLNKALITVSFSGLYPTWDVNKEMEIGLNVHGVYSADDSINIEVVYSGPNTPEQRLSQNAAGKYVIPGIRNTGIYTLGARMATLNDNYYMSLPVYQNFEIKQRPADFSDEMIVWQYFDDSKPNSQAVGILGSHTTPETAFDTDLVYTGSTYRFSLTSSETVLQGRGVRATYSGDTEAVNGGLYHITVTISAYDRNVTFVTKTYEFYYRINKAKYNLSDVKWDYTAPFTYTGDEYLVSVAGTLPEGLTATYTTNGLETNSAINAGSYSTIVKFHVSSDFADNYVVPDAELNTSYNGTFSFTLNWLINRRTINIKWKTTDSSSDIFFVPVLEVGDNYVDYSYERQLGDLWMESEKVITPDQGTYTYRVLAKLKPIYEANYILFDDPSDTDNSNPFVFTVDSGKQAVTIHIEINGKVCDDGQEFEYTGSPFVAAPVVDNGDLSVNEFSVKYYAVNAAGGKVGDALASAPVNVGRYAAVVAIKYENADQSYISEESETEIIFEIVKADYDTSILGWQYIHGNVIITASYNIIQKKWMDTDGNEAKFSFEYDTTPHEVRLIGNVEGLTVNVTGNSAINVGPQTARISFIADENHNVPEDFPTTLSWEITKAKLNLDKVKWGYTDASGVEHEFESSDNAIEYLRDASGEVHYTVGLINLPQDIRSFFHYNSKCYSRELSTAEAQGSTFASVGVYSTEYGITIPSGYNPGDNYERFSANMMPVTVPGSVIWEITEKNLTRPEFNSDWVTFDNKTHDLIAMCGIPEEEQYYYDIDITFTDTTGKINRNYEGYDGQKGYGFHAGTYLVAFYRIVGGEDIFWAQVEIEVGKAKLTVVWDNNGTIPVARVQGVYVSEMLETLYTNESGQKVDTDHILSKEGVRFYAQPYITSEYANNIQVEMAMNQQERISFISSRFTPDAQTRYLVKPEILDDTKEYTGSNITFTIPSWAAMYEGILYISDGSLTQRDVGKYQVVISFVKDTNACWADTDGNRNSIVLPFEITQPSVLPLDNPVMRFDALPYTGSEVRFEIINWDTLYNDHLYIKDGSDNLTQTEPGRYRVVLAFYEGSIGCWKDGSRSDVTLYFEVTAQQVYLSKPEFEFPWATYTGSNIQFNILDWNYLSRYLEYTGDSLTQRNVNVYSITFSFKEGVNARWRDSGDKRDYSLSFEIRNASGTFVPGENTVEIDKPAFESISLDLTGQSVTFVITNWDDIKAYIDINGALTYSKAGRYNIRFSFKEGADACWKDTGMQSDYTVTVTVIDPNAPPPSEGTYIDKPTIENPSRPYTGSEIQFEISNWSYYQNYLYIKEGGELTKTEVGSYYVILAFLSDKENCFWKDTRDRADLRIDYYITEPSAPGTESLPVPVLSNTSQEYAWELDFYISNWSSLRPYVTVHNVGLLGSNNSVKPIDTAAIIDNRIRFADPEAGQYVVILRVKEGVSAVWPDGSTLDFAIPFSITKAVITEAEVNNQGDLTVKTENNDNFADALDKLHEAGIIDYEYYDSNGSLVEKKDLVDGQEYEVRVIIKDKAEFEKRFDTSKVEDVFNDVQKITYEGKKPFKLSLTAIISLICAGVLIVLFIMLLCVVKAKKKREEEENGDGYDEDY